MGGTGRAAGEAKVAVACAYGALCWRSYTRTRLFQAVLVKGVVRLIRHETAGTLAAVSLTPIHSLRHRLVRSHQSARRVSRSDF